MNLRCLADVTNKSLNDQDDCVNIGIATHLCDVRYATKN